MSDERTLTESLVGLATASYEQGFRHGTDRYADVQRIIDNLDTEDQGILLLRLAARLNNGSEHFDHSPAGSSWLCLTCARAAPPGDVPGGEG